MKKLIAQYVDRSLTSQDFTCIKSVRRLPVVLKGVQAAAYVRIALQ